MTETAFSLPGSSFPEVKKIIKGYAHLGEKTDLTSLGKLLGMHHTVISASNGFLTDAGIIEGGKKKAITAPGKTLARALEHNRVEEIQRGWQGVVQSSPFLSNVVTTVRLKNSMSMDDLAAHIVWASGQAKHSKSVTGARTVIELLIESGVVLRTNDTVTVATRIEPEPETPSETAVVSAAAASAETHAAAPAAIPASPLGAERSIPLQPAQTAPGVSLAINIQLHLPESENPQVYENLFQALRKHLLTSNGN